FFLLMLPRPSRFTLFPYTTLFRSFRVQPSGCLFAANASAPLVKYPLSCGETSRPSYSSTSPRPTIQSRRSAARPSRTLHLTSARSEEHTSELQSLAYLVCRLLLEK